MADAVRSCAVPRWWRVLAVVGLVSGAFVAIAQPAAASQFTVTTVADSGAGSLRQAVLDANANAGPDEIVFDPSIDTQTITLTTGALSVTEELTVTGNGATNTIVDGNGTDRIFIISGLGAFMISGAMLQSGVSPSGDGGAVNSDGAVTIDATVVTDNSAPSDSGGGIAAATVTIQNGSVVRANQAGDDGGGVAATSGDVTVTDSTIGGAAPSDANTAGGGGGGVAANGGTATITSSTVSHNTAPGNGGGVRASAVVVAGSTVSNNSNGDQGGGIYGSDSVAVSASAITGNTAANSG
ncbi:MAG TPA: hypothetical protein VHP57_01750, partial [Acidimicrobiia bacterium]|nr:hypothetical protein [Acidimicrobiia bacterium]